MAHTVTRCTNWVRTRIAHTVTRRTNTDAHMVGAHGGSPLEAASADYEVIMMMNDVMFLCCPYLLHPALELTGRKIMPTSHVRKYAIIPSNADCIFSVEHLGNSLWLTVFSC